MAGRYDDKATFINRLQPIVDRQLVVYRRDPHTYVAELPLRMSGHFIGRGPSRKISLACLMAESLIATHRVPTAEYIWKLMHVAEEDGVLWQPHEDPGLTSIAS